MPGSDAEATIRQTMALRRIVPRLATIRRNLKRHRQPKSRAEARQFSRQRLLLLPENVFVGIGILAAAGGDAVDALKSQFSFRRC